MNTFLTTIVNIVCIYALFFFPLIQAKLQSHLIIVEHPQDKYVKKNEPATLNCRAEGDPSPIITWYREGKRVQTSMDISTSHRMLLQTGKLFFLKTQINKNVKDTGKYYCNATNPDTGEWVISKSAVLEIAQIDNDFIMEPEDVITTSGNSMVLKCVPPNGTPNPKIKWRHNGNNINVVNNIRKSRTYTNYQESDFSIKYTIEKNGNLIINNIVSEDSGIYVCVAYNEAAEIVSREAEITVQEMPSFVIKPISKSLLVGESAILNCKVRGNPTPTIFWQKNDSDELMLLHKNYGRLYIDSEGSLHIKNIQINDAGMYTCRAMSMMGSVAKSSTITVKQLHKMIPPPIIDQLPQDQTLPTKSTAIMHCKIRSSDGDENLKVEWYKNGDLINFFNSRLIKLDLNSFKIMNLEKSDTGKYVCRATLNDKMVQATATLNVINPKVALNTNVKFFQSNTESTLPGPPLNFLAFNVTSNSLVLKWDEGKLGSSKIEMYLIEYYSVWNTNETNVINNYENMKTWDTLFKTLEKQIVVKNLEKTRKYMFIVRAKNDHGFSAPSKILGPIILKTESNVKILQNGDSSVTENDSIVYLKLADILSSSQLMIEWRMIYIDDRIRGYIIKFNEMSGVFENNVAKSRKSGALISTQIYYVKNKKDLYRNIYNEILHGLKKFTWYEISVIPFLNDQYNMLEESNVIHARTMEDVPSSGPNDIEVAQISNDSIAVAWSAPKFESINGILNGYKLYIESSDSDYSNIVTTNATTNYIIVEQLDEKCVYTLTIAAITRVGIGEASEPLKIGPLASSLRSTDNLGYTTNKHWLYSTIIGLSGGILWFFISIIFVYLYRRKRYGFCWKQSLFKNYENTEIKMVDSHFKNSHDTVYDKISNPSTKNLNSVSLLKFSPARNGNECSSNINGKKCPNYSYMSQNYKRPREDQNFLNLNQSSLMRCSAYDAHVQDEYENFCSKFPIDLRYNLTKNQSFPLVHQTQNEFFKNEIPKKIIRFDATLPSPPLSGKKCIQNGENCNRVRQNKLLNIIQIENPDNLNASNAKKNRSSNSNLFNSFDSCTNTCKYDFISSTRNDQQIKKQQSMEQFVLKKMRESEGNVPLNIFSTCIVNPKNKKMNSMEYKNYFEAIENVYSSDYELSDTELPTNSKFEKKPKPKTPNTANSIKILS
ncbi:Neuroplastin [Intoshia linei]|uniref:Neuroplastin n=1 Tax=Intoshia linei TaxID=1819745 RepID=A0A177B0K4_9BILA|nr:Neuroplastin [Intoshia linei]